MNPLRMKKGSTRVPRVIFGVTPKISSTKHFFAKMSQMAARWFGRDAETCTRDACAPVTLQYLNASANI